MILFQVDEENNKETKYKGYISLRNNWTVMSQDCFVTSEKSRIRCLAGPGTGKTWSIKRRVERLLLEKEIPGNKIFVVTFTRLAAKQLKTELSAMGVPGSEDIVASTLHSHALRILQHEQAIEALGRYPRICFEYEKIPLYYDLSLCFNDKISPVKELMKEFETMWARNQHETPRSASTPNERQFYDVYINWMIFHGAMTVGEIIPLAVNFLSQNPINEAIEEFEQILVDEYQDLNRADQEFIDLLGQNSSITIVGDDDQSIYSFRHAEPEGIRNWIINQTNPEDVYLNICRRCDGKIVNLANELINHNPDRNKEDLLPLPEKENEGTIEVIQWNTRQNETQGIARGILKLLRLNQIPDGENIHVLVPRKEFGQYLKDELNYLGETDVKLHTNPDWSDQALGSKLTLLMLYANPNDLVSLRYWLGYGHSDWRRKEYSRLKDYCIQNKVSLSYVLENADICRQIRIIPLKEKWTDLKSKLDHLSKLTTREVVNEILPLEDEENEIIKTIRDSIEYDNPDLNLTEILTQAIISTDHEESNSKINIMTIFGAKGLTSHTVLVTSLINGLLPSKPSPISPEDIKKHEEERRLLYVAITRAKHRLILSSFRKVTPSENSRLRLGLPNHDPYCNTQSSKFITEVTSILPYALKGAAWIRNLEN
ncbi:MAG: DNA-dependent helicase II [Methanomethylovorans sp. PtaU1.Bin073]|nr:MAG: DNA-dependent helicase II [Methanomethylovorans sp. PtaU1.Bin073]